MILRESLARAVGLGLTQVLLTCGKKNVASAKVITRNGGIFDSEEYLPDRREIVQRYWIETARMPGSDAALDRLRR
jgi:predicted acetyltransferase